MIRALHIRDDQFRFPSLGRVVLLPFLFGKVLQEGIETLIHPGPLPLVAIDDHRKIVVTYFMDDDRNQVVFGRRGISPIFARSWAVETDHRIFHAPDRPIDADRDGIGVIERVATVDIQRMDDRVRRVLAPKRLAFVGVIAHGDHFVVIDTMALGIPDKLPTCGESEIADGFGAENPGFGLVGFFLFVFFGLLRSDDPNRLIGRASLFKSFPLLVGEHFVWILQLACSSNDMVGRCRDPHQVVSKFEREFTLA